MDDKSLLDLPRREDKEEVCGHCGATYTGLFHCQSLSQIKVIDDSEIVGVISELPPPKRAAVPITPLDAHMVEGRVLEVVREVKVVESTPHGPEGPAFWTAYNKAGGWVMSEPDKLLSLGDVSVQDDVMLATMMVNMRRYLGLEAGFVRAQGIDIDAKVPDCAVLSAKVDGALYWNYASITFDIKVEF